MNVNQLIARGSIEGPYRKTKPVVAGRLGWLLRDIRDLAHDLMFVWSNTKAAWRFARHMRRGGNPDHLPF